MESPENECHVTVLDHTADIGIIVRGRTLEELFEYAGLGMTSLMTGGARIPGDSLMQEINVEGPDREGVLFAFLAELLYLFDGENFAAARFGNSRYENESFSTRVYGAQIDKSAFSEGFGIKAVTYHKMQIENREGEWSTAIIFDV